MHERLALRLLRQLMGWDEETATREYRWIRLASRMKYDGYRDYLAGVRFAESLAGWLAQFKQGDRQTAYQFVKTRLIYFSPPEIQRYVEQLYPRFVAPRLRRSVAALTAVPEYLVLSHEKARVLFARAVRQTLFVGLSDGARLDQFRRANAGILVNEQVVLATHIDDEKWIDLGKKLKRADLFADDQTTPEFTSVYLVDDFTGSGTSFLRKESDGWTGKAVRFWEGLKNRRKSLKDKGVTLPLAPDFTAHVHHYISSFQAHSEIERRKDDIAAERSGDWYTSLEVTEGLLLPAQTKLAEPGDIDILLLAERHYDTSLSDELQDALSAVGQTHVKLGYGDSALPLVLEHNCPNNALTLLWAETGGTGGPAMRPLFPRRHRHA